MTAFAENSTDKFWFDLINWSNEEKRLPQGGGIYFKGGYCMRITFLIFLYATK